MKHSKQPIACVACTGIAALALLLTSSLASVAQAQTSAALPAMPTPTGATTTFVIKGYEVSGDVELSTAQTDEVLAPFVGPGATIETLQKATAALEAAYKANGFALHRVSLPPQEVGQKIKLSIVKFVIGQVKVSGNQSYDASNIRASVPELTEGQAPNFSRMAVQTAIANENPTKQIRVALKESEEANKIDATVLVKDARPWSFAVGLANTGSDSTGQDRLSFVGGHNNLWGRDHQLTAAYTTSIERPSDVKQIGLNYVVPLYQQAGVLGLSFTKSDVVGNFGAFSSTGAGRTYGVNFNHYFAHAGGRRSYLAVGLDEKQFSPSTYTTGGSTTVTSPFLVSRALTVGYKARVESDNVIWGYNADWVMNVPGGAGNQLSDYQNGGADLRVTNVNWRLLRGGVDYLRAAKGWVWRARGLFQFSPDALISGEQFGLGGGYSVRGTGERPLSGDSGVFASVEVTTPPLAPGWVALTFLDAGWLYNRNPTLSPVATDQLSSVGLGLRYQDDRYSLSADWGRLLTGSSVPPAVNPNAPKAGSNKLHVNLTAKF